MAPSLKDVTTKEVVANQQKLSETVQDHTERLDKLDGLERLIKKWWPWVTAFVSAVSIVITFGVKAVLDYKEIKDSARRELLLEKRVEALEKEK